MPGYNNKSLQFSSQIPHPVQSQATSWTIGVHLIMWSMNEVDNLNIGFCFFSLLKLSLHAHYKQKLFDIIPGITSYKNVCGNNRNQSSRWYVCMTCHTNISTLSLSNGRCKLKIFAELSYYFYMVIFAAIVLRIPILNIRKLTLVCFSKNNSCIKLRPIANLWQLWDIRISFSFHR